jgi:hypothetical protein
MKVICTGSAAHRQQAAAAGGVMLTEISGAQQQHKRQPFCGALCGKHNQAVAKEAGQGSARLLAAATTG